MLFALLGAALFALPRFGHYPGPVRRFDQLRAVPERHATNAVSAVTFDYRGFDTLGEEFILFASVTGVLLILRGRARIREIAARRKAAPRARRTQRSDSLDELWLHRRHHRLRARAHPARAPHAGRRIPGRRVLGTASMLVYLAIDYRIFKRITPKSLLEIAEALGAGGYVLIGLAGLCVGGGFLENVLPLGSTGTLFSAGTIPLINAAVGLEVAAGFALLFVEFLKQLRADLPP